MLGAQFGAVFLGVVQLLIKVGQGRVQLFGVEVAVVQGLVVLEALLALLQQNFGLLNGFFAVLHLLAQCADSRLVEGQQVRQAGVVKLRMLGAPLADTAVQRLEFAVQGLLALLAGLEVGGQLDQFAAGVLQLLIGLGLTLARLFHRLLKVLLPVLGTAVLTHQGAELCLGGLLLGAQLSQLLLQHGQLLLAMLLAVLFFFEGLLALLLLGQFILLVAELLQALADLLVQQHERGRGLRAQAFEGLGR